jgi:hypothetical protein
MAISSRVARGNERNSPIPAVEHREGSPERTVDLLWSSLDRGRIGDAPVRRHRLARPTRALFLRGVVVHSKDEAELRRFRLGELVP